MGEFDIGGSVGNQEAAAIPDGGPADEAAAGDGGVNYGDVGREFGFEDGVEVFGSVDSWWCKMRFV